MKTFILCLGLAVSTVVPAEAQLFQPEVSRNILLGGIAGAIIGNNNHHQALAGAAIGAAAGALWSAATVPSAQPVYAQSGQVVTYAPMAPAAPQAAAAPYYTDQPAQVVVVQSAPRVVYYSPAPVYYDAYPRIAFDLGWGWGWGRGWDRGGGRHDGWGRGHGR